MAAAGTVEYTGASGRDPFDSAAPLAPTAGGAVSKSSAANMLKLDGIIWGKKPLAVINGKAIKVGDEVSGFMLLEITKDGVKLKKNGEEKILSQKRASTS